MKELTLTELAAYDGSLDKPAYIGYKGLVYDVSESFLWNKGQHQGLHAAGRDLTAELDKAPHGAEFIVIFPVAGRIVPG